MPRKPLFAARLARWTLLGIAAHAGIAAAAGGGPPPPVLPNVPVDPDYQHGMDAIKKKDWAGAIAAFEQLAARKPDDAEAYNEMGFAERNRGNLDAAFHDYDHALALNPRHRGAHEYVGEAYLLTDNLEKAQEQLATLDKLCPIGCEEWRDLRDAITAYKRAHKQ